MRTKHPLLTGSTSMLLAVLSLASGAIAQDYMTYPSVTFPDEPGNQGIDFAAYYRHADELTARAREALSTRLDQAYGSDPKQRLDLYLPKNAQPNAPILLFIHGGAFEEGDRAHYGFVAEPFAARGIVTAVTSYRLTSRTPGEGHIYPAQSDDCKQAVLWLHRHAADFGADPHSIFVMGHSAGGQITAEIGVDRSWLTQAGVPADVLRGIVPISARYDYVSAEPMNREWAPTAELRERASPARHVENPARVALIAYGQHEEALVPAARQLEAALLAQGVKARVLQVPGADHATIALALGDDESPITQAILEMIQAAK